MTTSVTLHISAMHQRVYSKNFPGDPVVKNPPCNAGDASSIPGLETKVPYAEPTAAECHN